MEIAASASAGGYNMYGSTVYKQVYIYGGLDRSPTELTRGFGMAWGIGGWLLFNFLAKVGPEVEARLKARESQARSGRPSPVIILVPSRCLRRLIPT